jgi:hypothetical protein
MRLERRLTAAQVASMAIAGSFLLYLSVWQTMLPYHHHLGRVYGFGNFLWASRFEIARFALPFAVGMWMMYAALAALRRGVEEAIWSDLSLMNLRTQLDRVVWTVVAYTMPLTALGWFALRFFSIFNLLHHRTPWPGGLAYFFSSPLLCLLQLRQALRPKPIREPRIWPGDIKPLVSDHWGERATSQDIP